MISLSTAQKLKAAGLTWIPALHDFFGIPDRGLDDRVFVINEMQAYVEIRNNLPVVTFHGVLEWALDFVYAEEVVWLPTEEQLRVALMRHLYGEDQPAFNLSNTRDGYRCEIRVQGESFSWEDSEASEAYAAALLHLLHGGQGQTL